MTYVDTKRTLAELTDPGSRPDLPVGAYGVPTDDPDSVVFFFNAGFRVLGSSAGSGGSGAVSSFLGLTDTPSSFSGNGGRSLRVNTAGTALEFADVSSGVSTFLGLTDTPVAFAGSAGYDIRVNSAGTGVEFVAPTAALIARGAWDASTGSAPNGSPAAGDLYTVSVAGTFNSTDFGTDDSIYFAEGSWHKIEGGAGLQGGGGLGTVVGATDTSNVAPVEGQGPVWRADALGAGVDGFAYETFIEASVSDYAAGRILVTNGTGMVDQPYVPVPQGTASGDLSVWNQGTDSYDLLPAGAADELLTSTASGLGYQTLSSLFAKAGISSGIGSSDQTLTAGRALDLDGFNLSILFSSPSNEALASTWNAALQTLTLSARNTGGDTSLMEVAPQGVRWRFINDSSFELWDDVLGGYTRGQEGMGLVSGGPGGSLKFGWPTLYVFDTNGEAYEIVVDTAGNLSTQSTTPSTAAWSATPATTYNVSGTEGQQDFAPASTTYTLSNDGSDPINWTASSTDAWAVPSPASGTLAAGNTQVVTITADQAVLDDLPAGVEPATITFSGTSVPDLTRSASATVNSATANRAAVFPDDITQYAELTWAPTSQDFIVRFGASFTGPDDAVVFGGNIYENLGAIRKGSEELQFWIDGNNTNSVGMALSTNEGYVDIEVRRVGGVLSFWKGGVEVSQVANATTVPIADFTLQLGKMINGSTKPMQGFIDYFELIDPNDSTNNISYTMNSDSFANSAVGSVRGNGTNIGGVAFTDVV